MEYFFSGYSCYPYEERPGNFESFHQSGSDMNFPEDNYSHFHCYDFEESSVDL